ncbi:hypothetical protein BCR44DRAFT_38389 [Catenaria anguillulae PL171]|uniref:SUN domain-containing protein n=1 Tax=Catenaria anguillulae PL171 TaxID=765915 RepID=A0A1Y2HPE7_9FUNG|nr:hypothetical protein BCR44DRAFT_38389 [Catenaria anguillulae PL171]
MDRRQDYLRSHDLHRDQRRLASASGQSARDHDRDPDTGHDDETEPATVAQYNLRNRLVYASPKNSSSSRGAKPKKKVQPEQEQQRTGAPSPTVLARLYHFAGGRPSNPAPSSPTTTTATTAHMSVQAPTPNLLRQMNKRLVSPPFTNNPNQSHGASSNQHSLHGNGDGDDDDDDDDDEEQQDKNSPTRAQPKPTSKPKQPAADPSRPARRKINGELDQMTSKAFTADPSPAAIASRSATPLRPTESQMFRSLKTTLKRHVTFLMQNAQDLLSARIILAFVALVLAACVYFLGVRPMPYAPSDALVYPSPPFALVNEHAPLSSPMSEVRVKRSEPSTPHPREQSPSVPPTAPPLPASPPAFSNQQPQSQPQSQSESQQDLTHLHSLLDNHASTLSSLQSRLESTDKLRASLATDLRASILTQVQQAIETKLDDPEHLSRAASDIVSKAVSEKVAPVLDEFKKQIEQVKQQLDEVQTKQRAAEEERERTRARRALQVDEHQQASPSVSNLRDVALYTSGARIQHFLTSRTYSWPASPDARKSWWPFTWNAQVSAHPPEIALLSTSNSATTPDLLVGKCWTSLGARAVITVKLARIHGGAVGSPPSAPVQVGLAHVAQELAVEYSVAPSEVKVWAIVGDIGADQVKAVDEKVRALKAMAGGAPPRVDAGMPPPLVQQPQTPSKHQSRQNQVIPIDALDEISADQLTNRSEGAPLAKLLVASFPYPGNQVVRQGALVWTLASIPTETRAAFDAARVHLRLVAFEVVKNHGHADRSCVYRVGVFADVPSEYPGAREKVHV